MYIWVAESPELCALETDSFSLCMKISESQIASPTILLPRKAALLVRF